MKKKVIYILIIVLVTSLALPINVSAASGITKINEFEHLDTGDGQYIKYADNYHLDIKKIGIMDKDKELLNNVANVFFGFFKNISYLSIVVFYHCFSFDISEMFGSELNEIQFALRNLLFDGGIFLIIFATTAFYIVNRLLKGDIQGIFNEVFKVIAILIISLMVTTQSDTFLGFVNTTTKQVAVEALGGISGQPLSSGSSSVKEYAADASGMLWSGLVHKPWLSLEFGNDYTGNMDRYASDILSLSINSEGRKDLIEELYEDEDLFSEDVALDRLTSAFFMALPIILKSVFFLIIALLQMSFQIFTLFYIILCPLILLLAISPQLGGTELIWFWLKKVIETQLSILILTFVIGLIVKFDAILADWNNVGWLIGLYLQVFVMIALVLNWQKALSFMNRATRSIQNPRLALAMRQMGQGGMYVNTINGAVHGAQQLGSLASASGSGAAALASGAGTALMGGVSGAWDSLAENYTGKLNYNNVQQYQPRTSEPPPPAPSPGSEATQNINDAAGNGSVNASTVERRGQVIDYNKIPRYQSVQRSAAPVQQTVSHRMAANGEDLQIANRSTGQAGTNSTQRLYVDGYNEKFTNYADTTPMSRGDTVDYNAKAPEFKPQDRTVADTAQRPSDFNSKESNSASRAGTQARVMQRPAPINHNAKASSHIPKAETSSGVAQQAAPINYNAKTSSYIPKAETTAGVTRRPAPISHNVKTTGYIPKTETLTEAAHRPVTANYNAKASEYTPKTETLTEAAHRPVTANYNAKVSEYTTRAEMPTGASQGPYTAGNKQVPNNGAAKAQTQPKSPQKQVKEKPVSAPPQPINQAPINRNASVVNNTRQFTPRPVVNDFTFKTQDAPKKPIKTSELPKRQLTREPLVKPKPVVEQFNFQVHKPKK